MRIDNHHTHLYTNKSIAVIPFNINHKNTDNEYFVEMELPRK